MVQITVTAAVEKSMRRWGKEWLTVTSIQERALVPPPGATLTIEDSQPPLLRHKLQVITSEHIWRNGSEVYEIFAVGSFETLKHLAVVEGWHVENGFEELSREQQDFIRCREGTCGHQI